MFTEKVTIELSLSMEGVVVLLFVLGTVRSVVTAFWNQDFVPWRSVVTALGSLVFTFLRSVVIAFGSLVSVALRSVVTAFSTSLAHVSFRFRFSLRLPRRSSQSSAKLLIGGMPRIVARAHANRQCRTIMLKKGRCAVPAEAVALGRRSAERLPAVSLKEEKGRKVRGVRDGREAQQKGSIGFRQTIRAKLIATSRVPTSRKVATSIMPGAGTTSTTGTAATTGTPTGPVVTRVMSSVMPRPGQPGAMLFEKANITEFLRRWNIECDTFGLSADERCVNLPLYCVPEIQEIVEVLGGHVVRDWPLLQKELKALFSQYDKKKVTLSALTEIVRSGASSKIDLNIYVIRFAAMSEVLKGKGLLTDGERVRRFAEGLPRAERRRLMDFCLTKGWSLTMESEDATAPEFDEIKSFVLRRALLDQEMMSFENDSNVGDVFDEPKGLPKPPVQLPTMLPRPVGIPANLPTSMTDPIGDLTKKFEALALRIEGANAARPQDPRWATAGPTNANVAAGVRRQWVCPWCDSPAHSKRDCLGLAEAIHEGKVRLNDNRHIVNGETNEVMPLQIGRGGIRALFLPSAAATGPNVQANQVTIESPYAESGPDTGTVCIVTFHDDGSETHEYVDVDVEEKRKATDELEHGRNVRPRFNAPIPRPSMGIPAGMSGRPIAGPASPRSSDVPPKLSEMPQKPSEPPLAEKPKAKFRLGSDLHEQISMDRLTEKVLKQEVVLELNELLGVAPELSEKVGDAIRKKRHPILKPSADVASTTVEAEALYACASGKAKATIDNAVKIEALLDGGSEVCLMPRRVFEKLDLPIDTEIDWKINGYDQPEKARREVEEKGAVGVCHDVKINIGGVEVGLPVFVVNFSNSDLLLGRPWERLVRAKFDNRDDGSLWVEIRTPDGRRIVQFCAAKSDHERNRSFARPPGQGRPASPGKA